MLKLQSFLSLFEQFPFLLCSLLYAPTGQGLWRLCDMPVGIISRVEFHMYKKPYKCCCWYDCTLWWL